MKSHITIVAVAATLAAATVKASAITITQDGAPRATIVVAQSALAPAKDDASANKVSVAAYDLQEYLRKMSGATLPIVGDGSAPGGPVILVGRSRLADAPAFDIPAGLTAERDEEGFVIQCNGDRLLLAGNDEGPYHGTEYATYDFLNRLGVRWFMPGEFGEIVPTSPTIAFADVTLRQKPSFRQRNWWAHATPEMAALETRWKIRNKMSNDRVFAMPSDSSVRRFIAPPETAKTEPELFAKDADGSINPHFPNLTNPKTVEFAAAKVLEYFRAHPDESSLGIAPDDGVPRDFNPETVKLNQGFSLIGGREGVPAEMSATEEWIAWIDAVTRAVDKEMPGRIITTNGYANRNMAPFGVAIDPNISIMFAAIWSDTLHAFDDPKSWQMVRQGQVLQQWCKLNDKVWIYGYDYPMLASGLTPVPDVHQLGRDMPLMKKWGVIGFWDETNDVFVERGIASKYIKARLEWDANADVNALEDDFCKQWYGAAARPARAFWDAIEDTVESSPVLGHEDRVLPWVYTPELMATLARHLAEAEALADTPRDKLHVRIDRLVYEHLRAYTAMNDADLRGDFAEAARQARAMMAIRPQLHDINQFLIWPTEKTPTGGKDYKSGVWYWVITDRENYYQKLADRMSGKSGDLVAMLPQTAAFATDPFDEGRYAGWYQPDWDTHNWQRVTTAEPFYLQGHMDKYGHYYIGQVWYQFKVDVPASPQGKKVFLYCPYVETEAWAWVNGHYVGHRPYKESFERPNDMDVDVTDALRPGTNVISIRVSTSLNAAAEAGGLTSRLFLYTPRAPADAASLNP